MKTTPMMKCGHAANAVDKDGNPCCVICFMATGDASTQIAEQPKLDGRTARCTYYGKGVGRHDERPSSERAKSPHACKSEAPSSTSLAFFEHKPSEPFDRYYCGCFGWD